MPATLTINHATPKPTSLVLALWAVDTAPTYALPMDAPLAHLIAGSLGFPSKMPGTAYGLSAHRCITGSRLAAIAGTTCHGCYALKGNYIYSDVIRAHEIRLSGTRHPRWPEAMAFLLNAVHGTAKRPKGLKTKRVKAKGYHRWHDSGDLQSVAHLAAICRVATLTPTIRHWLPTREAAILAAFLAAGGTVPSNLLIRVSATKVDGAPTARWAHTSGVYDQLPPRGHRCTAPDTANQCGPCRACWSHTVPHVDYHLH
jgi:hypothetical protein